MADFKYKHKPFEHQATEIKISRDLAVRAIFWEQGTGKTKLIIDTMCSLYLDEEVDALLLVAPNGVHRNWLDDELPEHMPDGIKWHGFVYESPKAKAKWAIEALAKVTDYEGLAILCMSYDGFMTEKGKKTAWKFLQKRKCIYVLDESSDIKTPNAKRTKSILASSVYAPYRRVLDGTPVTNSPFDVYAQLKFLDKKFWYPYGIGSFAAFKTMFGIWKTEHNYAADKDYQVLVSYKNLDMLKEIVDSVSTRVLKDDVLDLPDKVYQKRYFKMTPEQWRCYRELKEECITMLASGEELTAGLAIVQLLRFQQITCGFLPAGDDAEGKLEHFAQNPRLDLLGEIIEKNPGPKIIWARFQEDINSIMKLVKKMGGSPGRYDGLCSDDEKAQTKKDFNNGKIEDFIGNPAAGARGLTLLPARTVIYYNNSFKLRERLQSEDRPHRIGLDHSVNYIDIQAEDTVDIKITDALRSHLEIASIVTGDTLKDWI